MGQQLFIFGAAFLGSAVESTEALTIVLAVGLTRGWRAPLLGAAAAVVALGVVVRRPLSRVPENTLKYGVGVILTSLGTFWAAEGMGARWPLDFVSILGLVAVYLAASQAAIGLIRRPAVA